MKQIDYEEVTLVTDNCDISPLINKLQVDLPIKMLKLALTHRSYSFEQQCDSNERLEFLGDAVLQLVITQHLYMNHPHTPEGDIAPMRAATVSQKPLAKAARRLGIGEFLRLGKGEIKTGGQEKDSLLCDAMEAIFGAVYLAYGLEVTAKLIMRLVAPELQLAEKGGAGIDWKTSIQEKVSQLKPGSSPVYSFNATGPDHAKHFVVTVNAAGIAVGKGSGSSKRAAEIEAARVAFLALESVEQTGVEKG